MTDKKNNPLLLPEVVEDVPKDVEKQDRKATTHSPFSGLPFVNKLREITTKSYRRVIKEEAGLADDLVNHQKSLGRLKDVDIEIETDKTRRRADLLTEQLKFKGLTREASLTKEDDEIAVLERKVERAKLKKSLRESEEKPAEEKSNIQIHEERLKEQRELDRLSANKKSEDLIENLDREVKWEESLEKEKNKYKAMWTDKFLAGKMTKKELEDKIEELEDKIFNLKISKGEGY